MTILNSTIRRMGKRTLRLYGNGKVYNTNARAFFLVSFRMLSIMTVVTTFILVFFCSYSFAVYPGDLTYCFFHAEDVGCFVWKVMLDVTLDKSCVSNVSCVRKIEKM